MCGAYGGAGLPDSQQKADIYQALYVAWSGIGCIPLWIGALLFWHAMNRMAATCLAHQLAHRK